MTRNRILILSVIACLVAGLILSIAYVGGLFGSAGKAVPQENVTEEAVVDSVPVPKVTNLSGVIESVSGNTFVLVVQYPEDPTLDSALQKRTVTVDENTVVKSFVRKDPELLKKEMAEFEIKMATFREKSGEEGTIVNSSTTLEVLELPPPGFTSKTEDISVLSLGQVVNIITENDIRTEESFIAKSIEIIPSPQ